MCKIADCNVRVRSRGWCNRHYQRWLNYGDPLFPVEDRYSSPEEAFAARTEWQGDCLIWTGSVNNKGYGVIQVNGKTVLTHRYSWEQSKGEIPKAIYVDHKDHCDTRCCNTEHLRLATHSQNNMNKQGGSTSSGHRNVYKHRNKWIVRLKKDGKYYFFGRFELDQLEEAAIVAEQARASMFGEFAGKG